MNNASPEFNQSENGRLQVLAQQARGAFKSGFGGTLKIEILGIGAILVDGSKAESIVKIDAGIEPHHAEWRGSPETLERIFAGGRALERAYLSGRLQINGDMSIMARLVLEAPQ